ncbi:MAG: hypothetical protein A2033_19630 [Bacteroidetes bacterium GWA2_31_9]|nr:MAG: hypothetical protein A2033_19630 [Bacteroidetes bacterium GWA2_31_9]
MIISSLNIVAQKTKVNTIWDIPHKTAWQKWMWIHRSIAFAITKERVIVFDTTYIKSYNKQLVITLPVSSRVLKFSLIDTKTGNRLTFSPNLQYNLGIGISSRWITFIYKRGIKLYSNDIGNKGETTYRDYQLGLYLRKFSTDFFLQNYSGFYIKNSRDYSSYLSENPYEIRSDVNSFHIGVSSNYIFNYKKFTYSNSFAFIEQQKKSAGSTLVGIYYSYFDATGIPSLISSTFQSNFDTLSLIRKGNSQNFGFNLGYIHTLVFLKKCYTTASVVQGFGAEQTNYVRDDNSEFHKITYGAGKLNVRLASGYDNERYFIGTMAVFDYFFLQEKSNSTFDFSFGKFLIYIGYRFSILKKERKLLRKLKLIDY